MESTSDKTIPIAIVGMSCRFPGEASNVENLWRMCTGSQDAWTPMKEDRFNPDGYYHPDSNRAGTTNVKGAYFLAEDLAHFDAPFFNITKEEAAAMDPQQRLMLECSYEALENAGIPLSKIVGTETAVFAGSFCRDWTDILNRDVEALPFYQATGTGQALLANRISYFYNLSGPSMSVDTACSSSLVAVHLACQSLKTGESKQALVGGSNIILSHETMISMSRFFHRMGVLMLMITAPTDQALKDGDTIRGIIRNTGTNQDGKTNGITLPSMAAQEALMKKVYNAAGLDPARTGYVEAHGTGTAVGDPLEAEALSKVFTQGRPASEPLIVGSVKTKIGHLEGASGLAGLIKAVLMLENNLILPNGNFEKANDRIPFGERRLKVPTTVQPWPTTRVRRASVCNYGYGGSNTHIIVDGTAGYLAKRKLPGAYRSIPSIPASIGEAVVTTPRESLEIARLFVLTAQNDASARLQTQMLSAYLTERRHVFNRYTFDSLAHTLCSRRSTFPWKAAISASSVEQLIERLQSDLTYTRSRRAPKLGFVFTGQGAQWHAMGRELIGSYPVFRDSMIRSGKYLKFLGATWSLLDELSKPAEDSQIGLGYLSQPACTAVQIALVDLLTSWGIMPWAVTGHSSGEIAAAYAAGALSQKSAIAVAYFRGLAAPVIKERYPNRKGSMLAVGLSREEAQNRVSELTKGQAVVACINSPSSVTVSGDEPAIEELLDMLQKEGVFARKVKVDIAYHSHHMLCIAEDYLAALASIHPLESTNVRFYSSVTGGPLSTSELQPSYWVTNMVSPVEFNDSLHSLCRYGNDGSSSGDFKPAVDVLVELGPSGALAGPIKQILRNDKDLRASSVKYISALARNQNSVDTALQLVSDLFKCGYPVNLDKVNNPSGWDKHQVLVDLPPYPWNHSEKYWAESREAREHRLRPAPRSDILGARVRNWMPQEPRWRNYVRPAELPWLRDHKIQGSTVYPAGGYVAMAVEAAREHASQTTLPISGYRLRDIKIGHALVVPEGEVETMISLQPCDSGSSAATAWSEFRIYSVSSNSNWTEHCRGFIAIQQEEVMDEEERKAQEQMILDAESTCLHHVDIKQMYKSLDAAGLQYGHSFSLITRSRAAPYRSIGTLSIYDTAEIMPSRYQHPCVVHPSTVDGFIQCLFPGMIEAEGSLQGTMVPTSIAEMFISAKVSTQPGHEFQVYSKSEMVDPLKRTSSVVAFDDNNVDPMISFEGLVCSALPSARTEQVSDAPAKLCFRTDWEASTAFISRESQAGNKLEANTDLSKFPNIQLVLGKGAGNRTFGPLIDALSGLGIHVSQNSISNLLFEDRISVVIAETLGDMLSNPSQSDLETLQAMLSGANGTLWVTRGATMDASNPDANLISGLARTVRLESNSKIITLDLDPVREIESSSAARCITEVFEKCFNSEYKSSDSDTEFTERSGVLIVPRIIEDESVNQTVCSTFESLAPEEHPFCQPGRPLVLKNSDETGDDYFVDDVELEQKMSESCVEIEVKASDFGSSGTSSAIGCRAHSGLISAVGEKVSTFQVGDRVTCLSDKPFCSYVRVEASRVQLIPERVSFEIAAAIPFAYSTAYFSLFKVASLEEGETVMVDARTGATGHALVRMSQAFDAEVLLLAETAEERKSLVKELSVSEDHVVLKSSYLSKAILRRTGNRGVDIVISTADSSSSELGQQLAACVGPFGRFLELSGADNAASNAKVVELKRVSNNITFSRVDFVQLLAQRPTQANRAFAQAIAFLKKHPKALPTDLTTLPISQLKDVLQVSSPDVVITTSPTALVHALPRPNASPLFRPDASYLLVGGLGGLGRSIAHWMVSKGAKHIVFASRSGLSPSNTSAQHLVQSLRSLGATVSVHACDVSHKAQLNTLLSSLAADPTSPPIRGVINAAMVIRNAFFRTLSHADYTASIAPKVRGTWNLHEAFSSQDRALSLDFFILLSSAIGTLGNPSQSAYGAASTFLDAFASFRLSHSPPLPCTSLALGMISDVGYVAENASVRQGLEALGFEGISERQLLGMVEFAVRHPARRVGGGTIVSGLGPYRGGDAAKRPGIVEGRFERYRATCCVAEAPGEHPARLNAGGHGDGDGPAGIRAKLAAALSSPSQPQPESEEMGSGAGGPGTEENQEAHALLTCALLSHLAGLLMVPAEDLTASKSMAEQGLDSLVAVQVRAWIAQATGVSVGILEVLGTESVGRVVGGV
ncbi:MAG: hypothetical protein LQ340_003808, partial [Diploschistes diacapsis]